MTRDTGSLGPAPGRRLRVVRKLNSLRHHPCGTGGILDANWQTELIRQGFNQLRMRPWGILAEAVPRFYLLSSLGLLALMLMVSMVAAGNLKGQSGGEQAPAAFINGTLVHAEDGSPVLVDGQRRYRIKATQEHLAATLRDEHLRGRKMRLEGRLNGEGCLRW